MDMDHRYIKTSVKLKDARENTGGPGRLSHEQTSCIALWLVRLG